MITVPVGEVYLHHRFREGVFSELLKAVQCCDRGAKELILGICKVDEFLVVQTLLTEPVATGNVRFVHDIGCHAVADAELCVQACPGTLRIVSTHHAKGRLTRIVSTSSAPKGLRFMIRSSASMAVWTHMLAGQCLR